MYAHHLARASLLAVAIATTSAPALAETAVSGPVDPQRDRPTQAQRKAAERARAAEQADASEGEVIVTGVRSSLAEARAEKREADQIVDVIKAEDVGKLPANTIGDVVAYIPGIQVGRDEGEVGDIQLRGLGNVQTTINGAESFSSLDRTAYIQDLPADLVKSVEVYKNATPDQIEGSGSGSINITLRRPLDFKRGLSGNAIATGRYNNQSKRYFQNYTGILNYRADTGIGEIGALLNVSYNTNPFLESRSFASVLGTVQTRQVTGNRLLPNPTFAPTEVKYQYNVGDRTTTSYSAGLQWRPSSNLSVVLEGNKSEIRVRRTVNELFMPVLIQASSVNTLPALSSVVLVPGTNRIASVTVSPVTQVGPISTNLDVFTDQYYGKFETTYTSDRADVTAQVNYNGSQADVSEQVIRNRFVNRPTYDVEFASTKYKFPQTSLTFKDLDLLDVSQYRLFQVDESLRVNDGSLIDGRIDLTLRTFGKGIDQFKFGVRGAFRNLVREVRPRQVTGLSVPISQLPAGLNSLTPIDEGFAGTGVENNARWLGFDRGALKANLPAIYSFLGQYSTVFQQDAPLSQSDFFNGSEDALAVYGQFHYTFNLIFPIDGVIGARAVNTMLNLNSNERITRTVVVNGVNTPVTVVTPNQTRQNGLDILPSASMRIRFTPNLQLRLGYTKTVNRPRTYDLAPFIQFSETALTGSGGNPGLLPAITQKYDASLEYYFGRTGIVTIAPFWWKLKRTIGTFQNLEILPGYDGIFTINRPINAGEGYRRGFEVQGQTFFTFLPGILGNFGAGGNLTYVETNLNYPPRPENPNLPIGDVPITGVAPKSFNLMGLFERGGLSGRVSYNWRDKFVTDIRSPLRNSDYILPVSWLEANISYRFQDGLFKNLSIGAQAQNLGASARRSFYGFPDQPKEVVYMARTYGLNVRYSF